MSGKPKSRKTHRKIDKKKKLKRSKALQAQDIVEVEEGTPDYPPNQNMVPMPAVDKGTINNLEKIIELSFLSYMRELKKKDIKNDCESVLHLTNILSEFLGPYILIGYLPDNEPIEMFNAPSMKDREAVLERLRKTFIKHMNSSMPE